MEKPPGAHERRDVTPNMTLPGIYARLPDGLSKTGGGKKQEDVKVDTENLSMSGPESRKSLEETVVELLAEKNYTVTTAESCTGGLIAGTLVNAAGASDVLNEGYVTYSNEAKERLAGVRHDTLERYGAVSEQTAREMAEGAAKAAGADAALSATGIAGPGGGTEEKPTGLVYIGCYLNGRTTVREFRFTGNRQENRLHTVEMALAMLKEELSESR